MRRSGEKITYLWLSCSSMASRHALGRHKAFAAFRNAAFLNTEAILSIDFGVRPELMCRLSRDVVGEANTMKKALSHWLFPTWLFPTLRILDVPGGVSGAARYRSYKVGRAYTMWHLRDGWSLNCESGIEPGGGRVRRRRHAAGGRAARLQCRRQLLFF